MAIEFEPTRWQSKCGRFVIYSSTYETGKCLPIDLQITVSTEFQPSFAAAVAWCEERQTKEEGDGNG